MKLSILAIGALAGSIAGAAHAAPGLPKAHRGAPVAEKVACAWIDGVRICNGYGREYGYGYGYPRRSYYGHPAYGGYPNNGRPEHYQTGSTDWWRAMDRDRRGGFR